MTQLHPEPLHREPLHPEPPHPEPRYAPPAPDPMARAVDPARPSRLVALTNWMVSRATGALEKRTSRRGFLVGSAMVGSAVAVSGCMVATQPGTPFNHITDCDGGLCTDGYTEFCCVINDGVNSCPPDSFPGGWWRADFSSWCNGTRYYIDCMQFCCGPATGYQNFCAGCAECRCAGDCNTRKVYCNYFRYGQCHQEIVETGPIACRVVTCVPPYQNDEWACSTAAAVDNSTAEHGTGCLTTLPRVPVLAPAATVFEAPIGVITVAARTGAGNLEARTFNGSVWLPPVNVISGVSLIDSAPASAVLSSGACAIARGLGGGLWYNRLVNGKWQSPQSIGGIQVTSDPAAIAVNDKIHVFVRSGPNNQVFRNRFDGNAWLGWDNLGGYATSNLTAAANGYGIFVLSRGYDGALWWRHPTTGQWLSLGGNLASDPSAVADDGSIWVFARFGGRQINYRRFDGLGWSPWWSIGGSVLGDPKAVMGLFGPVVFPRDDQGNIWRNAVNYHQSSDFRTMFGVATTAVNPVGAFTTRGMDAFMIGRGAEMWTGHFTDDFQGWSLLGGQYVPVTAG